MKRRNQYNIYLSFAWFSFLMPKPKNLLTPHYHLNSGYIINDLYYVLRCIFSILPALMRVIIIDKCWIFIVLFLHILKWNYLISILYLIMWYITLISLQILNHYHPAGINPTWSLGMILFIYYWIQIACVCYE